MSDEQPDPQGEARERYRREARRLAEIARRRAEIARAEWERRSGGRMVDYEVTPSPDIRPEDPEKTECIVWTGQHLDFSIDQVVMWFRPEELELAGGIEGLNALGIPSDPRAGPEPGSEPITP